MPAPSPARLTRKEKVARRRWKRKHGPSALRRRERRLPLQPAAPEAVAPQPTEV